MTSVNTLIMEVQPEFQMTCDPDAKKLMLDDEPCPREECQNMEVLLEEMDVTGLTPPLLDWVK